MATEPMSPGHLGGGCTALEARSSPAPTSSSRCRCIGPACFSGATTRRRCWRRRSARPPVRRSPRTGWVAAAGHRRRVIWGRPRARASVVLERKGVAYTEIDIIEEPARRDEMVGRAGGRTSVPQIFINGEHIGGSDELVALDRAGELDAKLGSAK